MGDPEFKIRDLIRRENVTVFSSNYALYGSLSAKVSETLLSMVPTIETYSIDESFLNLGKFREREVEALARELRDRVHRWIGIPTCVGIAPTKTLAKVANFLAKKRPQYRGVCDLRSSSIRAELLPTVPVDEVWGIGSASAAKLARLGVQTAADLAALDPDNARALMTVTGGRTVYELRGISCLPLELIEPTRKGIAVTRSFGASVTSWPEMREAIASYATRAAEKMRRYRVAAENIFVFMHTNTFNNDPFYSNGASARFLDTTNDTGEVVALAVRLGERLWRDGFRYSKCGVIITELMPETIGNRPCGASWTGRRESGPGKQWTSSTQPSGATLSAFSVPGRRRPLGSSGRSIARQGGPRDGMNCRRRRRAREPGLGLMSSVYVL